MTNSYIYVHIIQGCVCAEKLQCAEKRSIISQQVHITVWCCCCYSHHPHSLFFSAALYTTNNKQKQQQQMNMTVRWWWCILCKYIHIHTFFACTFHQQELNSTAATLNPHKLNQYNKWKGRRRRGKHQQCTQVHGEIVVTEGIMNNMLRDKVMK